jgi:indolepyruvate ferredoxin oxidoreductase
MGAGRLGGVVVCVGDDPQAKSSSVPSTSEPTLYGLGLPVLAPADPQEVLDLGLHGFALSRASGLWASLRIPASVADALQTLEVGSDRVVPVAPEVLVDGRPFVHRPTAHLLGATLIELEGSLYGPRTEVARRYASANGLDRVSTAGPDDVLGVVASGPAYLAVRHALDRLGLNDRARAAAGVRLLKVALVYPLDAQTVRRFAKDLREVVVVEDKRGFLEMLVKEALYGVTGAPAVVGKMDELGRPLLASTGEVDPDALVAVLAERILRLRDLPRVRRAADDVLSQRAVDPPLPRDERAAEARVRPVGRRGPARVAGLRRQAERGDHEVALRVHHACDGQHCGGVRLVGVEHGLQARRLARDQRGRDLGRHAHDGL